MTQEQKDVVLETVDKICKSVSYMDIIPGSEKSKLIQFSVQFCDNEGISKDAVEVVISNRLDDGMRELIVEVNGLVVKTALYETEMVAVKASSLGAAAAILESGGAAHPAGWIMAIVTGGAFYTLGDVIATATSEAAGEKAKVATANLLGLYKKVAKEPAANFKAVIPNSELSFIRLSNLENITSSDYDIGYTIAQKNNEYSIVINQSNDSMSIYGSKIFDPNSDAETVQNWVAAVTKSGASVVNVGNNSYQIIPDNNALLIRNAVNDIPTASYELSNIRIEIGEKLDLGTFGIYNIKAGDTISQLAKAHGYTVKELAQLNTWLFDENRIKFNSPDNVLVGLTTSIDIDHILEGSDIDDVLIDHNGGNDILIGQGGADYMDGGVGDDTYIAGDGDTIHDSDGIGHISFAGNNTRLSGGTLTESHELYDQYEGDGGTYYLLKTNNTLIFQKGEQFLTIENYHKDAKSLGITLSDELPELTIIGHMANENDGTVTGKVVLTQTYGRDIIVHLSTLDDTAHAGEDYQSDNDITVTIRAGETEGDFSVTLIDNQIVEGRETFFTQIDSVTDTSNQPIQYTIKDITPLTIEDDDGLNVSVFAPVVSENAGIATGAVTINKTYDTDLTLTLYTQDDSAVAGGSYPDYVGNNAITVTIAAGTTYAEFNVGIVDDDKPEPTETFYALVQSVVDSSGIAVDYTLVEAQPFTIEDDDPDNPDNPDPDPDPTPDPHYVTVSVSDGQNVESGGTISFVVSLSEVLSEDVTIDFITQDGTAVTSSDYVQYGRYGVTIPAGQRSAVYQVVLLNDEIPEPTETFSLTPYSLSYTGPENVLLSNSATGTIYDDDDPQYVSVHISDASAEERAEHMTFTVSLSKELTNDITISTSLGTVTIAAGDRSANVYASWPDDTIVEPDESFMVALTGCSYNGSEQVLLLNTSTGTIIDDDPERQPHPHPYDPDEPEPHDPLVLDLNQDGKISTIALEDSQVYFDITGDGVKERVGWVAPQDGFLVYDKNMNGKIEGIGEVFGKDGISGFAELRSVADTNYDNIIDRRDALFSQLKVWQDLNQDGISQSNELKSLSEAGVKNIELNVIGTNINLNGNILSEAGRYGDSTGERELAADIQLLASQRATSSNTTNTYEIDPITETLPQMRGYGFIDNSFKAYNLDPKLKELAIAFMEDKEYASANFGELILRWSGFYDMAASKGVGEDILSPYLADHSPIKLWILERFVGSTKEGWRTEVHLGENTNGGYHNQSFGNEAYVTDQFNQLSQRYEAMFALQAYYGDVFSDTYYDTGIDEFVIDDTAAFTTKLTEYLNDDTIEQSDKLYLASMMNNLEGTFLHFDAVSMIDSITDTTLKATITDIMEEKVHFQFAKDSGYYSYANTHVYGDGTNESLVINSAGEVTILAQRGDDLIRDNAGGNTTYLYRKGDGADTISDMGGADSLEFQDITLDEVTIEVKNTDLIITLKSDPSDQIRIIDWKKVSNRVESILFAGDSQVDLNELLFPKTEGDDYIELTNSNDTVDTLGGNDTVYAGGGNDTLIGGEGVDKLYGETGDDTLIGGMGDDILEGGAGNDTYHYNPGDGKDVITDSSGTDTLRFGDGIIQSDMIVKIVGSDMIIALRESGKTFEELSDVITIKNWTTSAAHRIETIILSDGSTLAIESLQSVSDENDTLFYGNTSANLNLGGGDDTITSDSGADTIRGGSGNDMINSGAGNDILEGNEGDDILIAGDGNDTLSGGVGNDVLQGGLGDDLYLFNRGDGKDTIIDEYRYGYNGSAQSNAGNDTLRFGEGITTSDLIARISGDDLILALKEEGKTFEELGDVITIKNWVNTASRVEMISLSDGSIVDLASIQSATEGDDNLIFGDSVVNVDALGGNDTLTTGSANDVLHGGEGNDILRSGAGDDTLYGDAGSDTLYAGIGNDTLSGGEGNDTLYGETGNDTLAGNGGNDTLIGGLGNDTYLFDLGDGHDTIIDEYAYGSGGSDTLRFGEGITADNLVARAVSGSNDLQIGIRESSKGFDELSDVITLKNWFDANKRIENFVLSDGTQISLSQMQGGTDGDDYLVFGDNDTLIDAMGGNDTVITANGNDTLSGGAGNDILISNNGNDTLEGGEGNDTLKAGAGDDTLSGGIGADTLEGGAGNDTYRFGIGDGKDRINDSSGLDTLVFGDGITADNLIARVVNGSDDLQIAIREEGKTFDQLSDVITISGWRNAVYRVENLRLSDGSAIALTQIERSSDGDDYLVFADEGVSVDALGGNDTLITGDGADTLSGGAGNDTILSGKGNDTLSGGAGTDTLKGGTGNDTYLFNRGDGADTIFDELGNDTLSFGEGITKDDLIFKQQGNSLLIGIAEVNKTFDQLSDVVTLTDWFTSDANIETLKFADKSVMNQSEIAGLFVANNIYGALYSKPGAIMYGGSGNNTYVYNRGDFAVVIDDQYQQGQIDVNAGMDTLYLSGGINKSDVTFGVVGNDLILKITPKVDTYEQLRDYVVIKNWASVNRGIEKVIFSNGETVTIDKNDIYPTTTFNYGWVSSQYLIYGDDVNSIIGTASDETFETNGGNDTINAGGGNDRIDAGAGNDTVEGGSGNDVITMGTGDDTVTDSGGNDVYKYNRGDEKDTIYDLAGNDTLVFGEKISANDLIVLVSNDTNDLIIAVREQGKTLDELKDKLVIKDWFIEYTRIEKFIFSDGSSWDINTIINKQGSEADDTIRLIDSTSDVVLSLYGGNDTVTTANGNDFIDGGEGDDIIITGSGNDILYGSRGNDSLQGGSGDDVYIYTRGDGNDVIIDQSGTDILKFGAGITSENIVSAAVIRGQQSNQAEKYQIGTDNNDIFVYAGGNGITIVNGYQTNDSVDLQDHDNVNIIRGVGSASSTVIKDSATDKYFFALSISRPSGSITSTSVNLYAYKKDHSASYLLATYKWGDPFFSAYDNFGGSQPYNEPYDRSSKWANTDFNFFNDGTLYIFKGNEEISDTFTASVCMNYAGGNCNRSDNFQEVLNFKMTSSVLNTIKNSGYYSEPLMVLNDYIGNVSINNYSSTELQLNLDDGSEIIVQNWNDNSKIEYFEFSDGSKINSDAFINDKNSATYSPPLILDLNANGTTSVSLTDSHTYFDYASDGLKEHTAWIEKGDALLVRDINNDGIINDGSELFGDKTKLADGTLASDGYAALAQYDTNNNGVIDKNDTDFAQLKLWQDVNQNGKTDVGELVDLSVAGITSLSLNRTDGSVYTQTTENGNIVTNETNYTTLSDTGTMRDVWFKIDATDTITDNDTIYGTAADETLSGDVGNDTYVIAYGGGKDVIDDNGNGADTLKFISGITSDRLIVQWIRGTDNLRIGIRENAEDDTPITELSNTITIKNWFSDTGAIEQFTFSDGTALNRQGIYDLLLDIEGDLTMRVLDAGDTLNGNSGNDVLYGLEGSETLYGKEGSDYLSGLSGDDYLSAGAGDDTLEGDSGDDTLEGGVGDDYYLFEKGDGKDLIIDAGGVDTLYFGNTIDRRDVFVNTDGEDLIVTFAYNEGVVGDIIDQITIKNWNVDDFKIESFAFNDGTSYTLAELIEKNTNHAPEMFFEESERALGKERSAKGILLVDDIDGDSLTYVIVSEPTMGTISIDPYGIWTYVGTSTNAGTDTVTIAVQDGRGGEVTTTLSFAMEALNEVPEATAEATYTLQDIRVFSGEVGASDVDGDTLTYTVSTTASHGTLSVDENGTWNYEAADGYIGSDSAVVAIDDGNGGVITQTLNFTIKVSAPTVADAFVNATEDTVASGIFDVLNPVGGTLTYEILDASSYGDFTFNEAGEWSYVPEHNLSGSDNVVFKITNEYGLSTIVTAAITIDPISDIPTLSFISKEDYQVSTDFEEVTYSGSYNTVAVSQLNGGMWYTDNADGRVEVGLGTVYNVTGNTSTVIELEKGVGNASNLYTTMEVKEGEVYQLELDYADRYLDVNEDTSTISVYWNDTLVDTIDPTSAIMSHYSLTLVSEMTGTGKLELRANDTDGVGMVLDNIRFSYLPDTGYAGHITRLPQIVAGLSDSSETLSLSMSGIPLNYILTDGTHTIVSKGAAYTIKVGSDWNLEGLYFIAPPQTNTTLVSLKVTATSTENDGSKSSYSEITRILILGDTTNTLTGGDSNDLLLGDAGNDALWGFEGDDLLDGGIGTDTLIGGMGNDTYIVDATSDIIIEYGEEGVDTVQSSVTYTLSDNIENLILTGSTIMHGTGNALDNILIGNSANNILNGKEGADIMIGGGGADKYYVDNVEDQVIEAFPSGPGDIVVSSISWTLGDNIEDLELIGSEAINATGNELDNILYSGMGDNVLDGRDGSDYASYVFAKSAVSVNLDITTAQNTIGAGIDTLINIENLRGSSYDDNLIGNSEANILKGYKGSDFLQGGTGNDTYRLDKGDGIDTIFDHDMNGNSDGGNDIIKFGTGIDESSVALYMNGNDLVISYGETDIVTVKNQSVAENSVEKLFLGVDHCYLTSNDIDRIIQSMNSYASSNDIEISSVESVRANQDLMNIIAAEWHK